MQEACKSNIAVRSQTYSQFWLVDEKTLGHTWHCCCFRYVEEHIQKTGVAIETQGFTFITSGRKRESLKVRCAWRLVALLIYRLRGKKWLRSLQRKASIEKQDNKLLYPVLSCSVVLLLYLYFSSCQLAFRHHVQTALMKFSRSVMATEAMHSMSTCIEVSSHSVYCSTQLCCIDTCTHAQTLFSRRP